MRCATNCACSAPSLSATSAGFSAFDSRVALKCLRNCWTFAAIAALATSRISGTLRKFQNVLEVRSAPRVNRLRIIADNHHVPVIASEQIDEVSLDFVRVLVFIDENKLKLPPIKFPDAFVLLKHRQRLFEQVVEIHRVGRLLLFLVANVNVVDFVE